MDTADFLALLKAAGCPPDLPLREVDAWVARALSVSERQAREWRLTGRVPGIAVVALRGMAKTPPAP